MLINLQIVLLAPMRLAALGVINSHSLVIAVLTNSTNISNQACQCATVEWINAMALKIVLMEKMSRIVRCLSRTLDCIK